MQDCVQIAGIHWHNFVSFYNLYDEPEDSFWRYCLVGIVAGISFRESEAQVGPRISLVLRNSADDTMHFHFDPDTIEDWVKDDVCGLELGSYVVLMCDKRLRKSSKSDHVVYRQVKQMDVIPADELGHRQAVAFENIDTYWEWLADIQFDAFSDTVRLSFDDWKNLTRHSCEKWSPLIGDLAHSAEKTDDEDAESDDDVVYDVELDASDSDDSAVDLADDKPIKSED
ncbi:uncharacterized protein PSFLO_00641 [Pseudozyma flocculosa]|uniref:Uncharacterized protein n=2 Tax=Pseudozyma flocculosa TaxID=84751 RepID=A0A5C3ETL1_9BASI|nr:uncharacterized protein PSFLO_00641 [Pseudozyma flocculosa]